MGCYVVIILFAFFVEGVFDDEAEVKSVKEGNLVALNTGVIKQQHDIVRWYFNDTLIALINGHRDTSCLYDGPDGRFRDRLKVDYESGSLIITNTTTEHTGRYEADIIRISHPGKSESLTEKKSRKCDSTKIIKKSSNHGGEILKLINLTVNGSGLSPGGVAGIVVGVLLLLAAVVGGVMIFRRRSSSDDMKKIKHFLEKMSKDKTPNEKGLII
ncbi:uncharacterized protein LOC127987127 [Carassius gibelio]|uniref:uncharacterized protein LOC127987127 n=1 Tax=Carassius gibelio TaxID=101364 RepID=UPI002278C4DA|nr:uncharacterized protein LOC127987127 [Carassius gibelio]